MKFFYEKFFTKKYFITGFSFFATLLLVFFSHPMFETHPLFGGLWQHHYYLSAAANPFDYSFAPYCWRVFLPTLIHFLPINYSVSFFVISFLSVWFSGVIVYHISNILTANKEMSLTGTLLFFSSVYAVRYNLIEFIGVDAAANFFILLSFYFMLKNKTAFFATTIFFGTMIKESALIMIPVYFVFLLFYEKRSFLYSLKRTFYVAVLPITVFILIRILISNENPYDILEIITKGIKYRYETLILGASTFHQPTPFSGNVVLSAAVNFYRLTFGVWALTPLLFLFSKKITDKKYVFLFIYFALSYLQIFVAGDHERLVALAFPTVVFLATISLQSLKERFSIKGSLALVWTSALFSVQLFLNGNFYYETYFSVAAQILLTLPFLGYVAYQINREKKR